MEQQHHNTKLHIVGETLSEDGFRIKISDNTFQRVLSSTGTKSVQFGDAAIDDLKFKNANGNSLVIKSTGNVGIGTTSPTEKLHVVGDALITGGLKVNAENIDFTGLSTSDPTVTGRLWNDRGVLKISAG